MIDVELEDRLRDARRALLAGMKLVRVADGDVIPLPAIARLSHIDMTDAQQRLEDLL